MTQATPQEIRDRIEECKRDLARAEGEEEQITKQIDADLAKLRKGLGCKPGQEKKAIAKLKAEIAEDEQTLNELISAAVAARDEDHDDDTE